MTAHGDLSVPQLFRVRLARGAAWSPVKIWWSEPADPVTGELMDRAPRWHAMVNGELLDDPFTIVHVIGTGGGPGVPTVKGEPINQTEYDHLLKLRAWAVEYDPTGPEANPRKSVDLNSLPTLF